MLDETGEWPMFQRVRQMWRRFTGQDGVDPDKVQFGTMPPETLFKVSGAKGDFAAPRAMIDTEKAYIDKYRANTRRPPEQPLFGLALSGGGIRSASIALGVMQALAAEGKLEKFDYLSTVSGGGYVGSALTWFTSRSWDIGGGKVVEFGTGSGKTLTPIFPYGTRGPVTPPLDPASVTERVLRYLSQHANYLEPVKGINILHPGKGINIMAAIAVVIRGVVVNLFVWLTLVTAILLAAILVSPPSGTPPMPGLFRWALWLSGWAAGIFGLTAIGYSLMTGKARLKRSRIPRWLLRFVTLNYGVRRFFDSFVPSFLTASAVLLMVGLVPIIDRLMGEWVRSVGLWSIAGGIASGLWTFWKSRQPGRRAPGLASSLVAPAGAFLILYGILLFAYHSAIAVAFDAQGYPFIAKIESVLGRTEAWLPDSIVASANDAARAVLAYSPQADASAVITLFILAGIAGVTGWFVNLNYTSIHRYYRDRLMESFLPDLASALRNETGAAWLGDRARLSALCDPKEARGPYHLVNCNVMLNDSKTRVWNLRGGDSFVLAPRYCGSSATGWIMTDQWINDSMTLATAMAISGAAANPGAGTGGVGPTRNQLVSILMAMLNLRLGYWVPNPIRGPAGAIMPNHFNPGLTEMLTLGRKENSHILQLSDGGHFDNLGLYELIRRKVRLIVVSDGTADPRFGFGDLLTVLPRLREDFGATIKFDDPPPSTRGVTMLSKGPPRANDPAPVDFILPYIDPETLPRYPAGVALARCGYAIARITYGDTTTGTLVYLKAAALQEMDLELRGYKGKIPDFPNESTLDQFYSDEKFEVHRGLGFFLTSQMLAALSKHTGRHPDLAAL
jgi:hypothetical protein